MRSSWRDANYTNYCVFKYQPYQGKSSVTVHSSKGRCSISGCLIKNALLHFKLAKSLTYLKEPSTPRYWQQFKPEPWWYNSSCIVALKGVHALWMRWHTTTCKHPPPVNYIRTGRWVGQRLHGNNWLYLHTAERVSPRQRLTLCFHCGWFQMQSAF